MVTMSLQRILTIYIFLLDVISSMKLVTYTAAYALLCSVYSIKQGYYLSPGLASLLLDMHIPHEQSLSTLTNIIYTSSSSTPYEGLSKGELMYIEDI